MVYVFILDWHTVFLSAVWVLDAHLAHKSLKIGVVCTDGETGFSGPGDIRRFESYSKINRSWVAQR